LAGDLARVLWERTTPAYQPWLSFTFSKGNAKLTKRLVFSLPAGRTCPGANICKAFVGSDSITGKRSIIDGKDMLFRCFAASSEVQYDAVYVNRKENLDLIVDSVCRHGTAVDLINASIQENRSKGITLVRIHESGDFFSGAYLECLDCWLHYSTLILKFYCYSKSLHLFHLRLSLPTNFYLTASKGGKWDHLIDAGQFPRFSVVVKDEAEAAALGLEVDHDDSHCFGDKPFALLVHGTQPKGSEMGKAIQAA
jgi:hypothetical protein